jgi:hypothetical protein
MAAVLTPVEFLVVRADTHGTAAGLGLLAVEALLGGAIYLAALSLLARGTLRELLGFARRMLRIRAAPAQTADAAERASVASG